ncbi:MAG: Mitochondrial inner membrane protein oxa1 [Bathelium mastoideum]|nr:MAG: Mitochondrial inner membrane protein oxa1 [Bathelium mastoideum]
MPPSRGFALPGLTFNQLRKAPWQGQCLISAPPVRTPRSFSTNARLLQTLHPPLSSTRLLSRWQHGHKCSVSLPRLLLGARFNSTAPSQPPTTAASSQPLAESGGAFEQINLDELTALERVDSSAITEHIGFLRELGVEYNWGFRATIEWVLEHIHVLAGTPWWLSIVLTTVLFRAVCIPVAMNMSNRSAKMAAMGPVIQPIRDKMKHATFSGDVKLREEATFELMDAYKSANVSPLKMILPALLPTFIGVSSFNLLRAMCAVPVPGLLDGGFLWVHDLTQPDPICAMPLASAVVIYLLLKSGGETGVQNGGAFSPKTMRRIRIGFPIVAFVLTAYIPAAVQITLLVATIWGGLQGLILRKPGVRERLGLYPIISTAAPSKNTVNRQLRVTIAPADLRQGAELISDPLKTYQAPQEQKKTIVQGATQEVKGVISEMRQGFSRLKASAGGDQRRTKVSREFMKAAKAYEERRATEVEDEVWTRQQTKEMLRKQKQGGAQKDGGSR